MRKKTLVWLCAVLCVVALGVTGTLTVPSFVNPFPTKGQGILVNPVHLATIYAAFVNYGNIIQPRLIYN